MSSKQSGEARVPENFRSRRWGSSLPCLLTRHSRSAPHRHEPIFSAARVFSIVLNHLPRLLRTHFKSFRKLQKFQQQKTLKNLKMSPSGARGGPQCFWGVSIPFFISFLRYWLNIGLCNQSGPLLLLSSKMLGWAAKVDHLSGQNSYI